MEIGRITGATRVLGKRQGYYGLPIRDEAKNLGDLPHMLLTLQNDAVTGPDTPTMTTAWLPNPDELAALAAGAPLFVALVGTAHPPIMVSVGEKPRNDPPGYDKCEACKGSGCGYGDNGVCEECNGCGNVRELP